MVAIPRNEKPAVDGHIVRMRPDLQYLDGRVPPVNVIHLHHGVWIDGKRGPFFFGGEEKTVFHLPRGYGYPYRTSDRWRLDQMIHNQLISYLSRRASGWFGTWISSRRPRGWREASGR